MQIKSLFTFWGSRTTVPAHYRVEVAFEQEPRLGDVDPEGELTREEQDAEVARARALPLFWQHVSRWTESAEARDEALRLLRACVNEIREDIMAPVGGDTSMLSALRVDESALTVAWVAGEPGDETVVWRRTWRVERVDALARVEDPSAPEAPETDYVRCGEVCDAHVDGDVVQVAVSATPVDLDAVRLAVETTLGVEIGALSADRWECVDGADNPAARVQRVAVLGETALQGVVVEYLDGPRAGERELVSADLDAAVSPEVARADRTAQIGSAAADLFHPVSEISPGTECFVWRMVRREQVISRVRVVARRYAAGDDLRVHRESFARLNPNSDLHAPANLTGDSSGTEPS